MILPYTSLAPMLRLRTKRTNDSNTPKRLKKVNAYQLDSNNIINNLCNGGPVQLQGCFMSIYLYI